MAQSLPVIGEQSGTVISNRPFSAKDSEGKTSDNTLFGEAITGGRVDDISLQFQYNVSINDVTSTTTGTGEITHIDSQARVHTGTGVGSAVIESRDTIRYRPGHECDIMFTTEMFETPEANTKQWAGLKNGADGFYIGYSGTVFGVYMLEGGNETFFPQDEFNHDTLDGSGDINNPSNMQLATDKFNIYKITFGWLGIAPAFFSVYAGHTRGWMLLHVIDRVNSGNIIGLDDEPHLQNASLPMQMGIERTSGTGADMHLHTSSWRGGVVQFGEENNASNRWFSHTRLEFAVTAGEETPVFTIRNEATFQGFTNHVIAELAVAAFTTDSNKSLAFYGIKNGTLGGTPAFNPINAESSTLSVDEAATSITGGGKGPATTLAKIDSLRVDTLGTRIMIYPGEDFSVTVDAPAGATGTVSVSFRIINYF